MISELVPPAVSPVVSVSHLSRRFGSFLAVNDVSFQVAPGEIFGYLGANGAGKSTTIRMLCGLLAPSSGSAMVAGFDVARQPEAVKASIGYMSQKFSLYLDLPVRANLEFFGGAYGLSGRELRMRSAETMEVTDLIGVADAPTGALPGGVRQRVALACSILHRPRVLFLDEPTAGVDPLSRRTFWRLIRDLSRAGTTVFVTTHYLDEAEYCNRIGLMVDGRLVALDTPDALKREYVPERVLAVRGSALVSASTALVGQPGIVAVEPFGAGLHVRVSQDGAGVSEQVAGTLCAAGAVDVVIEEGKPSLEDVFLAVVGRQSRGATVSETDRIEPEPPSQTGPPRAAKSNFIGRVLAMASKELLHIRRDPRTLYMALAMPIVLLLIFGYGVSFDTDRLPVTLIDSDRTPVSRALVREITAAREVIVEGHGDLQQADRTLRRGEALGALVIPSGFERELAAGREGRLQLVVDGADSVIANQMLSKMDALVRAAGARLQGASLKPPISVQISTLYNPAGKSALFMVPGLAVYLLAISAVLLTALAIAGEWERGSMEQLFASPVGRLEVVIGKLLPYLGLGMLQLLLVLSVGASVFGVPVRGSAALLFAMGFLFLVGMLGQGLLISVIARNQLVATQAGALSALLPSMLLSGMLVPIENMPRVLQWLSMVVPARYLVHALRGIMLRGAGLSSLWPDLLAQVVFAVAILALATLRFRRRIA